ncbi:condensin subunit ScpA [Fervidobacterium gondwanense DSM 13020]|uniref:Segregation and condensation protein A n=1 Tax=Fervidobacterium gondwanense DSM 13020 TaxID=1121883 RepID=A0A1M7T6W9_FERGO|nr:condensin subunit ScpA [Fervidobacterium gondwanense DSM 13020]
MYYVNQMEEFNLNITSEFIATAAYLLELKSKSLLPMSEKEKKEYEYKRELLIRRIEEYARLKELTEHIANSSNPDQYPVKIPYVFPKVDEKKLVKIVKAAIQEVEVKQKVYVIKKENYSLERIMAEIEEIYDNVSLYEILRNSNSRYEIIVKFLAVLELIRFERYTIDDDMVLRRVVKEDVATAR